MAPDVALRGTFANIGAPLSLDPFAPLRQGGGNYCTCEGTRPWPTPKRRKA